MTTVHLPVVKTAALPAPVHAIPAAAHERLKLPAGVRSLSREDITLVSIVPPSGYAEEMKAAAEAAAAAAGKRRVNVPCGICG